MDDDNNKNSKPTRMPRKKRGEPRLDFDIFEEDWWFVIKYLYPELTKPESFIKYLKKELRTIKEKIINNPNPYPITMIKEALDSWLQ